MNPDMRTRNELSICIRFLENGATVEAFVGLRQLRSTTAENIKDEIMKVLSAHRVQLEKIFWMAFDGASKMSGKRNSVQALLKRSGLTNGNYNHCCT